MTAVRRPDWMTAVADGYVAECDRCGWRRKYTSKPAARGGIAGHRCRPRTWRRCASCLGVCHLHDTDWVCADCGDEWGPDLDGYGYPGDLERDR